MANRLRGLVRVAAWVACGLVATGAWAQEEPEYRVGVEDVVRINVYGRPNLGSDVAVNQEGQLLIPGIGEVRAEGMTEKELSAELLKRFQRIIDPSIGDVVVAVLEPRSRTVTVVGEVRNPGKYFFRVIPDAYEIIVNAGGFTPTADMANVQIGRRDKEPRTVTVDLSGAAEGTIPDSLPTLEPHDTINVPTLVGESTIVTGSTFQVLGAVRTPGVYGLNTAGTVVEALARAGGPLPEANLKKVQLTRSNPTGIVSYRVDLKSLLYEGKPLADFDLKEGDTVTVPAKAFSAGSLGRGLVLFLPLVTSLTSLIVVLYD